jgi:hypothetical protein
MAGVIDSSACNSSARGAGAVHGARFYGYGWPPTRLIEVVAIAIGVLVAYAAGLTTLLFEALHATLTVERGMVKGVEREIVRSGR